MSNEKCVLMPYRALKMQPLTEATDKWFNPLGQFSAGCFSEGSNRGLCLLIQALVKTHNGASFPFLC